MAKDPRDFWGRLIPGVGEEQISEAQYQAEESGLAILKDIRNSMRLLAEGVPAGTPTGGKKSQAGVPYVLSLPFDPRRLTETIYAAPKERNLKTDKGVFAISATVPASSGGIPGTHTLTLNPPTGYVTLFVSPFSFTASYYSPDILVDLNMDGYDLTTPPYEYSLANAGQLNSALYSYITQYATITFTNNTTTPTTATATFEVLAVDANAFEREVWLPQVRESIAALESTAQGG